jgi:AP-1 complex subunit sigma 1/2
MPPKQKTKIVKDVTQLVLARRTRMCNFLEYKGAFEPRFELCIPSQEYFPDSKVVYRRYASLFFVCGIGPGDNELVTLEIIHRYVEVLDRYFGNVSTFQGLRSPSPHLIHDSCQVCELDL